MRYGWDEDKRQENLRRHGLDFMDAERVFAGPTVLKVDDRFDYGEDRFMSLGFLDGRVVSVVHTETDEMIRIISLRKASKREEAIYFEEIAN